MRLPNKRMAIGFVLSGILHGVAATLVVWPQEPLLKVAPSEARHATSGIEQAPPAFPAADTMAPSQVESAGRPPAALPFGLDVSALSRWTSHLWQSTLFAAAMWLLTMAFRKDRARVRYWLWFSASIKFFIPFSVLIEAGRALPWAQARMLPTSLQSLVVQLSPSLGVGLSLAPAAAPAALPELSTSVRIGVGVWLVGLVSVSLSRLSAWLRVRRALRASARLERRPASWPPGVHVRSAPGLLEPGVVGFLRPVILLPAGIEHQLTAAQLQSVVAHEACHIRRRDNLTATLHTLIESVYWFHPAVWWIGGRLVHERERACDQDVLRGGAEPRTYAEGIVNVCRRYVDVGLACVSGVSGSRIKQRVEAIMRNDVGQTTSNWKKSFLGTCGVVSIALPIVLGVLTARPVDAQLPVTAREAAFDAVSIKRHPSGDPTRAFETEPDGRFAAINMPLATVIEFAYDVPRFQLAGSPAWLGDDRFDVVATTSRSASLAEKRSMLRRLLGERFQLAVHTESRPQPSYVLVLANGNGRLGPRLRPAGDDCSQSEPPSTGPIGILPASAPRCGFLGFAAGTDFPSRTGGLTFRGLTMAGLAKKLGPIFGRHVADRTGLAGFYDADFDFIAEIPLPPPPPGEPRPSGRRPVGSAWTVFPEQLGLRFEAGLGPVDMLVIDRVDRPREN
jgi:bla regulator protein BlaR1